VDTGDPSICIPTAGSGGSRSNIRARNSKRGNRIMEDCPEQEPPPPFHGGEDDDSNSNNIDVEDGDDLFYNDSKQMRNNMSPHAVAELFPAHSSSYHNHLQHPLHDGGNSRNAGSRPTRESVLKRLSQSLLQSSLTKVSSGRWYCPKCLLFMFTIEIVSSRYHVHLFRNHTVFAD
jgi:hypothetical protein